MLVFSSENLACYTARPSCCFIFHEQVFRRLKRVIENRYTRRLPRILLSASVLSKSRMRTAHHPGQGGPHIMSVRLSDSRRDAILPPPLASDTQRRCGIPRNHSSNRLMCENTTNQKKTKIPFFEQAGRAVSIEKKAADKVASSRPLVRFL